MMVINIREVININEKRFFFGTKSTPILFCNESLFYQISSKFSIVFMQRNVKTNVMLTATKVIKQFVYGFPKKIHL